jgi:hypothetical protein
MTDPTPVVNIRCPKCNDVFTLDTPLTPEQILFYENQAAHEGFVHRVLVAFDIFCNVSFFGGFEDETISSHVRRMTDENTRHNLFAKILNHFLNVIQPNHGALAEAGDLERSLKVVATERQALGLPPIDLLK